MRPMPFVLTFSLISLDELCSVRCLSKSDRLLGCIPECNLEWADLHQQMLHVQTFVQILLLITAYLFQVIADPPS